MAVGSPPPQGPPQYGAPMGPPPQPMPNPHAPKQFDPKMTAYILGGSALAILIGIFTKSWATGGGRGETSVGIGPLGVEVCFGSVCRDADASMMPGDVQAIGYLALLSGLAAAGLAGYIAFLSFTNTPQRFPKFKIVNGILGLAAFGTTFFAIRLIIEGKEVSISWSPIFAIGGVIAVGVFVRKLKPYWPGEGNTPWPVATKPIAQLGPGAPQGYGAQPGYGAPGAPPQSGYPPNAGGFAPQQPPPGGFAPQQPPPGGFAPQHPPPGAAPMGPPPAAPHFGQPMAAPMGAPPMGAPSAPAAPHFGQPMGAPPMGAAPIGAPPMGAAPMGAPPMQHAPTQATGPATPAPLPFAATVAQQSPAQTKAPAKTVLGAPAPQLAALQAQPPAAAPAAAPGAAPAAQFCGRCGSPMQFVAQYQRWFCQKCQQYA